jgi:methyl-accepting chemotaxis protein
MNENATKRDIQKLDKKLTKQGDDLRAEIKQQGDDLRAEIRNSFEDLTALLRTFMEQVDERFRRIEEEQRQIKADINRLFDYMDKIAKHQEIDEQERLVMGHQLERLNRWTHELADKIGYSLSA